MDGCTMIHTLSACACRVRTVSSYMILSQFCIVFSFVDWDSVCSPFSVSTPLSSLAAGLFVLLSGIVILLFTLFSLTVFFAAHPVMFSQISTKAVINTSIFFFIFHTPSLAFMKQFVYFSKLLCRILVK